MGIRIFLYLDAALVPANSYTQAKEDGQRVVWLLQKLGFVLSLEKCQLESTQEFTHLGLVFNTQNRTLSLSWDNILAIKAKVAKVASSPTYRGMMKLLGLKNFASMTLPLARLHCCLPTILAQGELRDSSWSLQGTEARPRGCSDPALVAHLQTPTKVNIQTPDRGSGNDRCLQGGLWGHMSNLSSEEGGLWKNARTATSISWNWIQCGWPVKGLRIHWEGRLSPSR